MNYCSIEDAWGTNNYPSKQFKNKSEIEFFNDANNQKDYNANNQKENELTCETFVAHIQNCKTCQNKIKKRFKPQLIENFNNTINENKDTIVIILIGISILLFFNLIKNITKN